MINTTPDRLALIEQYRTGSPSVLIVDDDLNILSGLRDILSDSGYAVDVAMTAAEALDQLEQQTFSIMLVDYSLPDDNGINLIQSVQKKHPAMEFILTTGHDQCDIVGNMVKAGIRLDFLRKPVEVSTLLLTLERAVDRQCTRLEIKSPRPRVDQSAITPPPIVRRALPVPSPSLQARRVSSLVSPLPLEAPQTVLKNDRKDNRLYLGGAVMLLVGFSIGWFTRLPPKPRSLPEPAAAPVTTVAIQKAEPLNPPPVQTWTAKETVFAPQYYIPIDPNNRIPAGYTPDGAPIFKNQ